MTLVLVIKFLSNLFAIVFVNPLIPFEKLKDSIFCLLELNKPFNILPNFCSNDQIFFNACFVLILVVSPA